jgi:hypothetical protein
MFDEKCLKFLILIFLIFLHPISDYGKLTYFGFGSILNQNFGQNGKLK